MKTTVFILLAAFGLLVASAFAESASDIRRRMSERLPTLDSLKAQEAIGENNRGYVEVRGSGAGDAAQVVSAENRDREAVYGLIAKETGATADSVGKARAKQIAASSRSGVWVQDESGKWIKK
jgi:uncharacterized protein YdbL (DUF1318 family)